MKTMKTILVGKAAWPAKIHRKKPSLLLRKESVPLVAQGQMNVRTAETVPKLVATSAILASTSSTMKIRIMIMTKNTKDSA